MDTTNEITPEDSVVPVYLEPIPEEDRAALIDEQERIIFEQNELTAKRQSAVNKLTELGLTEEEVSALLGS
jgi:hypothetical protein